MSRRERWCRLSYEFCPFYSDLYVSLFFFFSGGVLGREGGYQKMSNFVPYRIGIWFGLIFLFRIATWLLWIEEYVYALFEPAVDGNQKVVCTRWMDGYDVLGRWENECRYTVETPASSSGSYHWDHRIY
jgi:hypothetical protein